MRPNVLGSKVLFLNPSSDKLSTANLAAIDSAYASDGVYPYAYTSTVRTDYDAFNFLTDDAGSALAVGTRTAVGLFLSPENDRGNFLFQVSGKVYLRLSGTTTGCTVNFFFGRKLTNNTVVSSKAGTNNQLDKWIHLPSKEIISAGWSNAGVGIHQSIETEVFTLKDTTAYNYCFGVFIDGDTTNAVTLKGGISLAIRKYNSEISSFSPVG